LALSNSVLDDCNWVLTTSSGFVIVAASVPASPPERKL
jgi:hypothetical protein